MQEYLCLPSDEVVSFSAMSTTCAAMVSNDSTSHFARRTFWILLAVLLLAKLILELVFFVGAVNQYGEEYQFVSLTIPSAEPGRTYWTSIAEFKSVKDWATWQGDPGFMYPFRVSAIYPNVLFGKLFGYNEWSLSLWPLLCGLGSVFLTALTGRRLADSATGLGAAAVLALIPGHVLYSARINTDMPQIFFLALGIWLLVMALTSDEASAQQRWAWAAGLGYGLLYLAKLPPAVLAWGWALVITLGLAAWRDAASLQVAGEGRWRQAGRVCAGLVGGFLVVVLVENVAYWSMTGVWGLHLKILQGNSLNLPSWRGSVVYEWGPFRIWDPPLGRMDWLAHCRTFWASMMPPEKVTDVYQVPQHGWSAPLALVSLIALPFMRPARAYLLALIIAGFALYFVYQEFIWFYPTSEADGKIGLTLIHKVHRFVMPCYLGIALAGGAAIGGLWRASQRARGRVRRTILALSPTLIVLAFAVLNWPRLTSLHAYLRGSLQDTRLACELVRQSVPDGVQLFIPATTESYYQLLLYPHHHRLGYYVDYNSGNFPEEGFGIVGGGQGIGISSSEAPSCYPERLRPFLAELAPPPPGWKILAFAPGSPSQAAMPIRIVHWSRDPAAIPEVPVNSDTEINIVSP
jgi:Dolichyl-phosphate-mannose-protein mannosyltransferase